MLARATASAARRLTAARFASTLVVAEHNAGAISPDTLAAVTAAKSIGGSVDLLVTGKAAGDAATAAAGIAGVDKVLKAEADCLEGGIAEEVAAAVLACQASNSYTHIMASSTNFGKNFLPRVSAKLDVAQISDVMAIEGEDTFTRPLYAGNAIARVRSSDPVKTMTIRTTGFEKAAETGGSASVEDAPAFEVVGKSVFTSEEKAASDRPDLGAANIVVAGGRALKSAENFDLIYKLADKMGAAVGASRAAVDAGYCSNDMQVGQTGKIVAPDLYIAIGISGAIQHLAGMKDAKVIVAINKDEEAPIFSVSDYGLVADLFKAVPELTEKLPARA